MQELTDERLQQILADCEGVTPGPWEPTQDWPDSDARVIRAGSMAVAQSWVADAKHLANFDPDTVRALVTGYTFYKELAEGLQAERDALRADVERALFRWQGALDERDALRRKVIAKEDEFAKLFHVHEDALAEVERLRREVIAKEDEFAKLFHVHEDALAEVERRTPRCSCCKTEMSAPMPYGACYDCHLQLEQEGHDCPGPCPKRIPDTHEKCVYHAGHTGDCSA